MPSAGGADTDGNPAGRRDHFLQYIAMYFPDQYAALLVCVGVCFDVSVYAGAECGGAWNEEKAAADGDLDPADYGILKQDGDPGEAGTG